MKSAVLSGVVGGSAIAAVLLVGGIASAQIDGASAQVGGVSAQTGGGYGAHGGGSHMGSWSGGGRMPGVMGTVASISGDTLTVTSKSREQSSSGTTYTIDASSATVMKDAATSSLSAIVVGDTVMVQGAVSGTSVTATKIIDGMMNGGMGGMRGRGMGMASSTRDAGATMQGNGQPVVGGTISAISGSTITITNASNVTYSVDVSSATVMEGDATSSTSALAVGDRVIVQGTVSGSTVTAASVIDQGAASADSAQSGSAPSVSVSQSHGVLGALGGFFHKLFGFF